MAARASVRDDIGIDHGTSPLPVPDNVGSKESTHETSISIGICAYNEARRLPVLFESLAAQRLPRDFVVREILVVASGCTDGTERVVENWAHVEPRVTLIRESE